MLSHQCELNSVDKFGFQIIHYLSASWSYQSVQLLTDAGADVHMTHKITQMTALHYAATATSLKFSMGEGARILNSIGPVTESDPLEELSRPHGADTLKVLLRAGAKPNLKDSLGRTALYIIAECDQSNNTSSKWGTSDELIDAVVVLLSYGSRIEESPVLIALRNKFPDVNLAAVIEKWNSLPILNCDGLEIKLNEFCSADDLSFDGTTSPTTVTESPACLLCGFHFTMFKRYLLANFPFYI